MMYVTRQLVAITLGLALLCNCSPTATSAPRTAPVASAGQPAVAPPAEPVSPPRPASDALPAPFPPLTPPVAVRVADLQVGHYVGLYVALARGYFESEGLAISLEPFDTAERVIPPMATGQADVAIPGMSAGLLNAVARGVALKIVAGGVVGTEGSGGAAVLVRKDLVDSGQFRDYPDLRGLRVGTPGLSTSLGRALGRMLTTGGLAVSDIDVVPIAPHDAPLALANGAVDVGMVNQPYAASAVKLGAAVRWKSVGDVYPGQQSTVVLYAPQFAERYPEAATRFLTAYLRGVRDYHAAYDAGDPTPMYHILAEHTPIKDLSLLEELGRTTVDSNGTLHPANIAADQDFWVAQGFIPQRSDLESAVDLQYLQAALARLGSR
jgi:NitT/TauT family transport system substrate-binding protein